MKEDKQDTIKGALYKKAMGYDAEEVVEEYSADESGDIKLTKKKVTKKNVPPDVTALKILIDESIPVEQMSDEELEKEKKRLIKLLKEK